ncbi:MAG: MFS transporter [Bacteroidales bacterium]|nr:MAG: MFS transporter [Bacteroidales bacterium]
MTATFKKDIQYYKFCLYGFLKNQRFFDPFLMLFFLEKNLLFVQIGVLYSIRMITRTILEIPSGIIADALGRRGTMIFSYVFYILSFIIYYFASNYLFLIIATFIFAVGDAFRTGTHKAMIFEYLKLKDWEDQKVHYYGHTRSWSQTGSAVSSLIAALIVFYSGRYTDIFLFTLIPYVIGLVLLSSYPRILEGAGTKKTDQSIADAFKEIIHKMYSSFRNLKAFKIITNLSSFSGYFMAIKDYLQPVLQLYTTAIPVLLFLDQKKREALIIGAVYFILYFISSRASKYSGKSADRFSNILKPLNLTLILGLITGVLAGVFLKFNIAIVSIVLFIGIHIIENLRRPMAVSYASETFNDKILASVLSVESQAKSLVAAIFAVLLGFFADYISIEFSFIITSLILLFATPLFILRKK